MMTPLSSYDIFFTGVHIEHSSLPIGNHAIIINERSNCPVLCSQ